MPLAFFLLDARERPRLDVFARYRLSEDLPVWAQLTVVALVLLTVGFLLIETRNKGSWKRAIIFTGALGALLLGLSVLRPTVQRELGHEVPGLTLVLMDDSHRMDLPSENHELSRRSVGLGVTQTLGKRWKQSRVEERVVSGAALPNEAERGRGRVVESDVLAALRRLASEPGERPQSVVLVSDGRLTKPVGADGPEWVAAVKNAAGGVPVHTVRTIENAPEDRSIRKLGFTGSAVAHQPLTLSLEVGCEPAALCASVEVVVRELLEGQTPAELVRGKATGVDGLARLQLEVTLERAGGRVIEVELLGSSDSVPENNKRILPVQVRRDRLRMLHVAGRPTYDVRALRMFLKSDESIDLVSFFILRTMNNQVGASQDELALIPFPVDELFSEHLKSFDAVVLQDIDAPRYGLDLYFESLKNYVLKGGGLILVGGPTGFSSGGYAGSAVADVLPVELPVQGDLTTKRPFTPIYTAAGRSAPLLRSLRQSLGESLPEMSGANLFGPAKPSAVVLWEHPSLSGAGASGGEPMPVLALGEIGDGRTIAISVDSTHQLRFGKLGTAAGGHAYDELWAGLLGWLMRDPRFEGAQVQLEGDCIAGRDQFIRVEPPPPADVKVEVTLQKLGQVASDVRVLESAPSLKDGAPRRIAREMTEGGYAARVQIGEAPATRMVFACETGGEAWSDSRPDRARMEAIARATSGVSVDLSELSKLPPPTSTFVASRRESSPFLPPWAWSLLSAVVLSGHWVLRRTAGYA